jgi:hypothetical protein
MASALRIETFKSKKLSRPSTSLATTIGQIVMRTMSPHGVSRVLSSKQLSGANGLLGRIHTPNGRKKALAALAKVKSPLYSVSRDAQTGQYLIVKGRIKAGEFVRSR